MQLQPACSITLAITTLVLESTIAMLHGNHTIASHVPWDVAIHDLAGKAGCRGTIISDRTILTLASCVPNDLGNYQIRASYASLVPVGDDEGLVLHIKAIHSHPRYQTQSQRPGNYSLYDLAIVEFVDNTSPDERRLHGMPLNMMSEFPEPRYDQPFVVGFQSDGKAEQRGKMSMVQPLQSSDECEPFGAKDFPDSMMCAGLSDGKSGPCAADSGAGLIVNVFGDKVVAGVMTTGTNYCQGSKAKIVYHRVSWHLEWIVHLHAQISQRLQLPSSLCACKLVEQCLSN